MPHFLILETPVMPNTRNSELCQQTKDSIANAAVDLLLAEPGAELSVTRLCRQAGVSRNAFYRNFDAVEEVVGYYLALPLDPLCFPRCRIGGICWNRRGGI